jgi:hypothetical protein
LAFRDNEDYQKENGFGNRQIPPDEGAKMDGRRSENRQRIAWLGAS